MDIEIVNTKVEPLLKRTHFEAKVVFSGKTPSRSEMKKELCHKLGSKEEMTVVNKIETAYGSERAVITGFSYDDPQTMKDLVDDYVHLRHLSTAEQKAKREEIKAAKQAAAPQSGGKKKK